MSSVDVHHISARLGLVSARDGSELIADVVHGANREQEVGGRVFNHRLDRRDAAGEQDDHDDCRPADNHAEKYTDVTAVA